MYPGVPRNVIFILAFHYFHVTELTGGGVLVKNHGSFVFPHLRKFWLHFSRKQQERQARVHTIAKNCGMRIAV